MMSPNFWHSLYSVLFTQMALVVKALVILQWAAAMWRRSSSMALAGFGRLVAHPLSHLHLKFCLVNQISDHFSAPSHLSLSPLSGRPAESESLFTWDRHVQFQIRRLHCGAGCYQQVGSHILIRVNWIGWRPALLLRVCVKPHLTQQRGKGQRALMKLFVPQWERNSRQPLTSLTIKRPLSVWRCGHVWLTPTHGSAERVNSAFHACIPCKTTPWS